MNCNKHSCFGCFIPSQAPPQDMVHNQLKNATFEWCVCNVYVFVSVQQATEIPIS